MLIRAFEFLNIYNLFIPPLNFLVHLLKRSKLENKALKHIFMDMDLV